MLLNSHTLSHTLNQSEITNAKLGRVLHKAMCYNLVLPCALPSRNQRGTGSDTYAKYGNKAGMKIHRKTTILQKDGAV